MPQEIPPGFQRVSLEVWKVHKKALRRSMKIGYWVGCYWFLLAVWNVFSIPRTGKWWLPMAIWTIFCSGVGGWYITKSEEVRLEIKKVDASIHTLS